MLENVLFCVTGRYRYTFAKQKIKARTGPPETKGFQAGTPIKKLFLCNFCDVWVWTFVPVKESFHIDYITNFEFFYSD